MKIRDLIYYDQDKIASLSSQLNAGLTDSWTESQEAARQTEMDGQLGVSIAKARGAYSKSDLISSSATFKAYHNVLLEVESMLDEHRLITDLSLYPGGCNSDELRASLVKSPFIRVTGMATIEDFTMLQAMAEQMHVFTGFVSRCSSLDEQVAPEVQSALKGIEKCYRDLRFTCDAKERLKLLKKIDETQQHFDQITESQLGSTPSWLIHGITDWIQFFSPDRVIYKIATDDQPDGFCLANLNTNKLVGNDLGHILFSYGHTTNVPITLFGVATNIPSPDKGEAMEPDSELINNNDVDMSKAYENMFESIREIFKLMNPVKYPRIAVDPIAIYRSIESLSI